MGVKTIDQELAQRREMWNLLLESGGPNGVAPEVLRTLGIYGGAQGIWVDKARTGELTDDGHGITVSLTHSGKSYPDDFSDDFVAMSRRLCEGSTCTTIVGWASRV